MKRLTHSEFESRIQTKYDLLEVRSTFINARSLVSMYCRRTDEFDQEHGSYETRGGDLLNQGRGCQKCANDSRKRAQQKYTHDKHFFEIPNLTNSYWGGFIAADGSVSEKRAWVTVALKEADREHLEKFRSDIGYDGNIYYHEGILNGTVFRKSTIMIADAHRIIRDLACNYLITPKKSMILRPPIHLSDENQLAYLKGYLDGDGHIRSDGPRFRVGACGTYESIEWIKNWFDRISLPESGKIADVRRQGNIYVYEIAYGRAQRVLDYLRTVQTPHLRRKWGHD